METINEEFMTRDKAVSFKDATLRAYPPAQYGTRCTVRRTHCKSFWEVSGSRFH